MLTQAWDGRRPGRHVSTELRRSDHDPADPVRVSISAPDGMRFTSWDDRLSLEGDHLVYEGTPSGDLDLEASFAPPLPLRIWRSLT